MRAFQEAFPNPPSIPVRQVLVRDGLWVLEGVNDYGGEWYLTSWPSSS
jgi:hypothetical protein